MHSPVSSMYRTSWPSARSPRRYIREHHVTPPVVREITWFDNGSMEVKVGTMVDGLSTVLLVVVTLVSLLVHVFSLIGFRNRISVVFHWAWAYVFSRREARLITEREWRLRN